MTYMRLIAADTIEEAIIEALERKTAMARSMLGDADPGTLISRLNKDEMCSLLMHNKLPSLDTVV